MNTPRDILLNQHRGAEPALDAIRERVLDQELRRPAAGRKSQPLNWLTLAWRQLVLPCRGAWAGLAAAWLAVLLLHLVTAEPVQQASSVALSRPGATRAQLKQQWLLRAELLGIATVRPEPPATPPGPHSEATPPRTTMLRQEETVTS